MRGLRFAGLGLWAVVCAFGCGGDAAAPDGGTDSGAESGTDATTADSSGDDLSSCADEDSDGHHALACGGDDCDDTNAARYPGATEVCDAADLDEDCDPATFGTTDLDADGHVSLACCNGAVCGDDCDDGAMSVHPSATEACNLIDDNCNGIVDETVAMQSFLPDCDYDGWATPVGTPMVGCTPPTAPPASCTGTGTHGWASMFGDCADDNPMVHPGLPEIPCNGTDDDCDAATTDSAPMMFYVDGDMDGFGDPTMPLAATGCAPPPGYAANSTDCNDADGSVHPGATELCNGRDDNCDGVLYSLPGMPGNTEDDDGDHYPDSAVCGTPVGMGGDCNDMEATAHPGGTELPADGIDANCDGMELCWVDLDGDGYRQDTPQPSTVLSCTGAGFVTMATTGGDCCDLSGSTNARYAHPGAPTTAPVAPDTIATTTHYFNRATPCGGWDWNCNGVENKEAQRSPTRRYTGTCGLGGSGGAGTCGTRTTGWDSAGPPTVCGMSGTWSEGCDLMTLPPPTGGTFCLQHDTNYVMYCR